MILQHCYYNQAIVPHDDVKISPTDLALHRGYGVFDYFTFHHGQNKYIEWYLDRFYRSIKEAKIKLSESREDIKDICGQLSKINDHALINIKLIATGGNSTNGYHSHGDNALLVLAYAHRANPEHMYQNGINLISFEYQRPFAHIKSINYFNSYLLQDRVQKYAATDILYYNNGVITETTRANIFVIKEGQIMTPARNILPGITRKVILEDYKISNIAEVDISFDSIMQADEIFITSTTKYVMPVVQIDQHKIGTGQPGPVSKKISNWICNQLS